MIVQMWLPKFKSIINREHTGRQHVFGKDREYSCLHMSFFAAARNKIPSPQMAPPFLTYCLFIKDKKEKLFVSQFEITSIIATSNSCKESSSSFLCNGYQVSEAILARRKAPIKQNCLMRNCTALHRLGSCSFNERVNRKALKESDY